MTIVWLQTSKNHNNFRIIFLILLMPLIIYISVVLFFAISYSELSLNDNLYLSLTYLLWASPLILLWLLIWIYFQKKIIFSFTHTKEITREENAEIYNIVENLCISKWLPIPKIWIIETTNMNAFATWWDKKNSHIVFSRWLIENLTKEEIEAVAAHELTHIINWDVKTMVIANVFIWIIGSIWYILMRTKSKWKNWAPIVILWLILYLVSLIILPLVNLAISRKKEFLADAWSVELTKNKDAMISALEKISKKAFIPDIEKRWVWIESMFIYSPKNIWSKIKWLLSTHPSLEERIELLKKY